MARPVYDQVRQGIKRLSGELIAMNKRVTIYILADPRDRKVRYVGKTVMDLQIRMHDHLYGAKTWRGVTPKDDWLRELISIGMEPAVIVLEQTSEDDWQNRERAWVMQFRDRGAALLNCRRGGWDMGDCRAFLGRPKVRPQAPINLIKRAAWLNETTLQFANGMLVRIDAEDYERVVDFVWHPLGKKPYAIAHRPGSRRQVLMHRLIMDAEEGRTIDHVNGDRLDNRKTNLRFCTITQNGQNSKPKGGGPYKGVHYYQSRNRWSARIFHAGKEVSLGYWDSQEEAARAYDQAALHFFGSFARLNFPDDPPPEPGLPTVIHRRKGYKPRYYRDETRKECAICREIKPRSEFAQVIATPGADINETRCRPCDKVRRAKYR